MGKGKGDIGATFGTNAGSRSTKGGCKTCPAVPKLAKKNNRIRCRGPKEDKQTQSNHTLKMQKVRGSRMKTWQKTSGKAVAGNLLSCCFCNSKSFYPKKDLALVGPDKSRQGS